MKRMMCLLLSAVMVFQAPTLTALAKPAWPADTGIESEAGIVMDMDSGAVLYGQKIHDKKAPASITKLLTALVVIENGNLSDTVTFSNDAVYNVESGSGNKLALDEGDKLTVEECLYALLLQSSNQSANALAEHVAGSRDAFVELMNKKVKELGCQNTNFANPSGLNDDNQYVSAYDMALIAKAAYSNETLLKIGSSKSYKIPATKNNPSGATFGMEHKLLITTDPASSTFYPYAISGKTGYTSIAGQTLVTYAKKDSRRLICVTLKSAKATHYKDTIALLNFGFNDFQNVNILQSEQAPSGDTVTLGDKTYSLSDLSADTAAVITLPNGAVFADAVKSVETALPETHPKGAAALITYTYDERKIGQLYVMSAGRAMEEETGPTESAGIDAASETDGAPVSADKAPISIPFRGILTAMVILVAAAIACGLFFHLKKKKDEERRVQAERRRRRKQRLEEVGCSDEEFDKLLRHRIETSRTVKTGHRPGRDSGPKRTGGRNKEFDNL